MGNELSRVRTKPDGDGGLRNVLSPHTEYVVVISRLENFGAWCRRLIDAPHSQSHHDGMSRMSCMNSYQQSNLHCRYRVVLR